MRERVNEGHRVEVWILEILICKGSTLRQLIKLVAVKKMKILRLCPGSILLLLLIIINLTNGQSIREQRYPLGAGNLTCQIANCSACDTNPETVCDNCDGNLVFISPGCVCPPGYFRLRDTTCQKCIENCDTCTTSSDCGNCHDKYFFNGSACSLCSSNCLKCVGSNSCQTCEDGYSKNNGVCNGEADGVTSTVIIDNKLVQCPTGCKNCTSLTACETCINGYFKDGNICSKCHTSCLTCNGANANNCLTCPTGFLPESNRCQQCDDVNCHQCNPQGVCSVCRTGYGPSAGSCVNCPNNCIDCSADTTVCSECQGGFTLVNNECVECLTGCVQCNPADFSCISCGLGFYMNSGSCTHCPEGCQSCTSNTDCTSCLDKYKLSGSSCVKVCSYPCASCTNTSSTTCLSCYGGYAQSGNRCNPDGTCNQTSSCTICARGYYITNQNKCQQCALPSNCIKCDSSNPSGCIECDMSYYLDENSNCVSCEGGCSECVSPKYCTACADGYFLSQINGQSSGLCQACSASANCATCLGSASRCLTCNSGYKLSGIKCVSNTSIKFRTVLDTDVATFIQNMNAFKDELVAGLGAPYSSNRNWVTINSITPGSVVVDTTLDVPPEQSADSVKTSADNLLAPGGTIAEMPIISSQSTVDGGTDPDPPEVESSGADLGLILGLSLPLVLILLSLVLICKYRATEAPRSTYKTTSYESGGEEDLQSSSSSAQKT